LRTGIAKWGRQLAKKYYDADSVAGVARRQNRRAAYGYGVGAGVATAAAVGTAASVAVTAPLGWGGYYGSGPYVGTGPYVVTGALAARAYYGGGPIQTSPFYLQRAYYANGPWYGYSGWDDYKTRNALACEPGALFKRDDGLMHVCQ
jgi:hypothetical protein